MKRKFFVKFFVLPIVVGAFTFSSYGEQSAKTSGEISNYEGSEQVSQIANTQTSSSANLHMLATVPDELAKQSGAAQMIPKSAELFVNVKDIEELANIIFKSDTAKAGEDLLNESLDEDSKSSFVKEVLEDEDFMQVMGVAGEEMFIALGQGTGKNLKYLRPFIEEFSTASFKTEMNREVESMKYRIDENHERNRLRPEEMFFKSDFFKDGIALRNLKNMEMPSVYAGFKVSNAEDREAYTKQLQAAFEIPMEEGVPALTPETADVGGGFKGFKWSGKKIVEEFEAQIAGEDENPMLELLGEKMYADMKAELSKKEAVFLVGSVGDYVVFFFGKSVADLKLAESADESVLANDDLAFSHKYEDKKVASLFYMNKSIQKSLMNSSMEPMTDAIKEIVVGDELFGDLSVFSERLDDVVLKEKALLLSRQYSRIGAVAYYEDGFKIDTFTGDSTSLLDLNTERKLANTVHQPDSAISASWVIDKDQSKLTLDFLESLASAAHEAYAIAAVIPLEDDDWIEFSEVFNMMNGMFRDDAIRVWAALRKDLANGTSAEGGLSMDLKGEMPKFDGLPKEIVEHAKMPRFAYVTSVTDRKKIQDAWAKLHLANKNVITHIGELTDQKIEIPKLELTKKGGLDIWSYDFGITSYQANTAVALNGELFFLTTSPAFVEKLAGKHDAGKGKKAKGGAEFVIRFDPIRENATQWVDLFTEHGEALLSERENEEMQQHEKLLKKLIKASNELESISFNAWRGEENRGTLHIKTRK